MNLYSRKSSFATLIFITIFSIIVLTLITIFPSDNIPEIAAYIFLPLTIILGWVKYFYQKKLDINQPQEKKIAQKILESDNYHGHYLEQVYLLIITLKMLL